MYHYVVDVISNKQCEGKFLDQTLDKGKKMNTPIEKQANPVCTILNDGGSHLPMRSETILRKMKQILMIVLLLMTVATTFLPTPVFADGPGDCTGCSVKP